jgi:hypothetical protein
VTPRETSPGSGLADGESTRLGHVIWGGQYISQVVGWRRGMVSQ